MATARKIVHRDWLNWQEPVEQRKNLVVLFFSHKQRPQALSQQGADISSLWDLVSDSRSLPAIEVSNQCSWFAATILINVGSLLFPVFCKQALSFCTAVPEGWCNYISERKGGLPWKVEDWKSSVSQVTYQLHLCLTHAEKAWEQVLFLQSGLCGSSLIVFATVCLCLGPLRL